MKRTLALAIALFALFAISITTVNTACAASTMRVVMKDGVKVLEHNPGILPGIGTVIAGFLSVEDIDGKIYYWNFWTKSWEEGVSFGSLGFVPNIPGPHYYPLSDKIKSPANFKFVGVVPSWLRTFWLYFYEWIELQTPSDWLSQLIGKILEFFINLPVFPYICTFYWDGSADDINNPTTTTTVPDDGNVWEFPGDSSILKLRLLVEHPDGTGDFELWLNFDGISCEGFHIAKGQSAPDSAWKFFEVSSQGSIIVRNWCGILEFSHGNNCPGGWKDVSSSRFWNGKTGDDSHTLINLRDYLLHPSCPAPVTTTTTVNPPTTTTTVLPPTTTTTVYVPPTTTTTVLPPTTTTTVLPPTTTTTTIDPYPNIIVGIPVRVQTYSDGTGLYEITLNSFAPGTMWFLHGQNYQDEMRWTRDYPTVRDRVIQVRWPIGTTFEASLQYFDGVWNWFGTPWISKCLFWNGIWGDDAHFHFPMT